MQTKMFDVNNLRIATPCPMSWDQMLGDDRTRHCRMCTRNVFNISEMTSLEVAQLVETTNGNFCAKLYRRSDGTVITEDCPVGVRTRRRRVARIATAALTALLSAFSISFAQKRDTKKVDAAKLNPLASAETDAALSIFGVVMDPNGAVVPNVKLVLRDATKKIELTTFTDSDGKYSFPRTAGGVYDLITAGTAGFIDLRVENISIRPDYKTELNIVLNVDVETTVLIGVVAGPEGSIDMSPEIKTTITREMLDRIPGRRLPF